MGPDLAHCDDLAGRNLHPSQLTIDVFHDSCELPMGPQMREKAKNIRNKQEDNEIRSEFKSLWRMQARTICGKHWKLMRE